MMTRANFWKKMIVPPKRNTPLPIVVIAPLKMLIPMAETDSVALASLD